MFGNISPFFTNWGPASATQGGILTASGVQQLGGAKQLNAPSSTTQASLEFNNGTSNWINMGGNGLGAPTFTTRSLGMKIVILSGSLDASHVDWGFGMLSGAMYASIRDATASNNFRIYGGTTQIWNVRGDGLVSTTGGEVHKTRVSLTTPITAATSDYYLESNLTTPGAVAVSLPASPASGFVLIIKDGKGDANTNNITITPAAGNIDGAGTKVINTAYGAVRLIYNGTQWTTF